MINLFILLLLVYIIDALSLNRLFALAGEDSWKAYVPVYNRYTQLKILERPKWWISILFLPIVGTIFHFALHADFIRCYGKRKTIDALLVVLSLGLYVTYINYDKNTKWVGVEKRKETFIASVLFAIIFATVIHTFIAQPFVIPTGSMENTLRRGDFLIVNKVAYGIRFPMSPVGIPFLQNKIPLTGDKPGNQVDSYLRPIELPYFRFPGYQKIKNNSLVVFNYPTDSLHIAIDRKDPYVKRCVAIPGDTLEIKAGVLHINGVPETLPADAERQYSYYVETKNVELKKEFLENNIGFITEFYVIPRNEYQLENPADANVTNIKQLMIDNNVIIDSVTQYNDSYKLYSRQSLENIMQVKDSIPEISNASITLLRQVPVYLFMGLTDEMVQKLKSYDFITSVTKAIEPKGKKDIKYYDSKGKLTFTPTNHTDSTNTIFPINKDWNKDWYGPLYMPKKGDVIKLNKDNLDQYFNIVNRYEKSNVTIEDNTIIVNGEVVPEFEYTIQQNYYFMIGDNRHNSLDCRYFGYVPEDHVLGKPSFHWMSLQGGFDNGSSKIRTDRIFKVPNNGTPMKDKFNWGWIIIPLIVGFFWWDNRRRKKKKEAEE